MLTILLERLKMFLLHFVKYCELGRAYHIIVTACCALTFFQQIPIAHIYSMVSTVLGTNALSSGNLSVFTTRLYAP